MTDEQIIKALECCTSDEVGMCHICPLDGGCNGDITILLNCSLDLINRQKETINQLRKNNDVIMQTIADVHTEAIKEFADRLKMANISKLTWFNEDFDYLVKEMVGENNGN